MAARGITDEYVHQAFSAPSSTVPGKGSKRFHIIAPLRGITLHVIYKELSGNRKLIITVYKD